MKRTLEKEDYVFFSLFFTAVLAVLFVLVYRFWLSSFFSLPVCPFYHYLGVYCPACGGTRALMALCSGNFLASIYYHPIVLYTVLVLGVYFFLQIVDRLRGKKKYTLPFSLAFVYVGIAVLLGNWIFRLVCLFCFHVRFF